MRILTRERGCHFDGCHSGCQQNSMFYASGMMDFDCSNSAQSRYSDNHNTFEV
nr:hypothetical protein [Providencia rettgeri]